MSRSDERFDEICFSCKLFVGLESYEVIYLSIYLLTYSCTPSAVKIPLMFLGLKSFLLLRDFTSFAVLCLLHSITFFQIMSLSHEKIG
jgi:hypothetical protein